MIRFNATVSMIQDSLLRFLPLSFSISTIQGIVDKYNQGWSLSVSISIIFIRYTTFLKDHP